MQHHLLAKNSHDTGGGFLINTLNGHGYEESTLFLQGFKIFGTENFDSIYHKINIGTMFEYEIGYNFYIVNEPKLKLYLQIGTGIGIWNLEANKTIREGNYSSGIADKWECFYKGVGVGIPRMFSINYDIGIWHLSYSKGTTLIQILEKHQSTEDINLCDPILLPSLSEYKDDRASTFLYFSW